MNRIVERLKKMAIVDLTYWMCEDWFIYAYDKSGKIYFLNTELWPEWEDAAKDQNKPIEEIWEEQDAVEKYMLPIAKKKWNNLNWRPSDYNIHDLKK